MKQALEALALVASSDEWQGFQTYEGQIATSAYEALRQAIAEAEKQEPAFYVIQATDRFGEGYEQTYWEDPAGFPVYTRPVYASDISQKCVDETAKSEHEFEEMVKKGTKAWDGVPDDWVDELRGGAEKQEPMAFRNTETGEFCTGGFLRKDWAKWQPLYAAPVQARPVVHEVRCTYPQCQATNGCVGACSKGKQEGWVLREVYFSEGEPISHREPQWVGLTDEELPEGETYDFDRGVRWAEQYLKQKIVPSDYLNSHQQEPVSELLKLMAEDGVTGVLIEVHRGPLSKSIRTWGECDCPTSTYNDVTIEVRP
jgi:hypothetical protein